MDSAAAGPLGRPPAAPRAARRAGCLRFAFRTHRFDPAVLSFAPAARSPWIRTCRWSRC